MAAQPRRIIVGYDGTDAGRRALDAAVELMGYGSTLTVVSVTPNGETAALSEARERLLEMLVTASYVPRSGDPAGELVAAAGELGADLVVVGRRSGPEAARGAPGSVSADVVRHAPCDVLVVG
jgi:nucleotide-binding universal stress UspA family protein